MKIEKELFVPYIAGRLGKTMEETKTFEKKLEEFNPTVKV